MGSPIISRNIHLTVFTVRTVHFHQLFFGQEPAHTVVWHHFTGIKHQFQIKDAIKAARIEATKAYDQYAEEPKTSQRRWGVDMELV